MRAIRVLMYEPAFHRIESRLKQRSLLVDPILVSGSGSVANSGAAGTVDTEVAWASPEVFTDGQLAHFMAAVLGSSGVRWLQSGAAGYDHPLLKAALAKGIVLTRSDAPATAVAEHVFATVFDYYSDGQRRREHQRTRSWRPQSFRELAGTSWLLVGFGSIGRCIATRALAFESRVVAVSRTGTAAMNGVTSLAAGHLLDQLAHADIVVLALALSPETVGLVDETFIGAMKPDALLVNVARGAIVDDTALLAGLDRGRPAHAILDVFSTEPLPPDSPYWSHPRVTVSSHLAGMGSGLAARSDALFIENLQRYASGEPLLGRVTQ